MITRKNDKELIECYEASNIHQLIAKYVRAQVLLFYAGSEYRIHFPFHYIMSMIMV